ncbi:hypothetical protein DFH08DRAFT_814869 [Mycena albidolilacea]|uniref:Uncharacterized protein n=1 Tax=Mycena albidolilacea TaxID=1033008 RepID=A0AAD6ZNY6_9AGAR|nr:hypothetical protein DFH08DRAFT_814869 [Mycena albidolilacea]
MERDSSTEAPFTSDSISYDPDSSLRGSGMVSDCQNFTVTGKTLNNVTNHYFTAPTVPSDRHYNNLCARKLACYNIDLRHEIRVDIDTGVVDHQRPGAEELSSQVQQEWRRAVVKHMLPKIIQVYEAASSGGIHAALQNDALAPMHRLDPPLDRLDLCRARTPRNFFRGCDDLDEIPSMWGTNSLSAPNTETMAIDCMSLETHRQYAATIGKKHWRVGGGAVGEVMEDSWTRSFWLRRPNETKSKTTTHSVRVAGCSRSVDNYAESVYVSVMRYLNPVEMPTQTYHDLH